MTALIVIATILASLAAYLTIGIRFAARPYVTRAIEEHCERFPRLTGPSEIERERRFEAFFGLLLALVWPAYLLVRLAVGSLAASAPLSSLEARELIKQRDKRIAELEREVGMRR